MIKTPGNLQDLNQRISGMGKAEAVGEGGVGPDDVVRVESIPDLLGLIIFAAKRTGERSAGNRHAPFDVAGAGNGTFQGLPHQSSTLLPRWIRPCRRWQPPGLTTRRVATPWS